MSFMPNPGSVVRLWWGPVAIVTKVTPLGDGDAVWDGRAEIPVDYRDIEAVIYEPGERDAYTDTYKAARLYPTSEREAA